jgi:hypothetical protein
MPYNFVKIVLNILLLSISFKSAAMPIFKVEFLLGATNFPSSVGLYDQAIEKLLNITNQSSIDMVNIQYYPADGFAIDPINTTCGATLNQKSSCTLALVFTPNRLGRYISKFKVCGGSGAWCSNFPTIFDIYVTQNAIVSTNCNDIKQRPFSTQDCQSSETYANNFKLFMQKVLHASNSSKSQFNYFQHIPSANETTVPCLEARQNGVNLDANIQGGGIPLCDLMQMSTSNASATNSPVVSKLFPPFLNFLLATSYPITNATVPLADLSQLQTQFATSSMDASVRSLGYQGYVNLLSSYYYQQVDKIYENCGGSVVCSSIFYIPYVLSGDKASLTSWPPLRNYWGISGGGGSGAGYQIVAFKPGSSTHYTLFTGGGGGGGGMTTPEMSGSNVRDLISTGSGGGGGSQFAECYKVGNESLNQLGLGAGTGSGLSTEEGTLVTYAGPPAVDYSFYPPLTHPTWTHNEILTQYTTNLDYLFNTLLPQLYNDGYTITVSGGGGGGTGLEFLNQQGAEFADHPVSISYGFNFCSAFNKDNEFQSSDCISSSSTTMSTGAVATDLDTLIYQNVGNFYNQGMELAILPQNCNGYANFSCTCTFQHSYVLCQLEDLLLANHYTINDIPTWLITPHCSETEQELETIGQTIDTYLLSANGYSSNCAKSVEDFFQAKSGTNCVVPWG